MTLSVIQFPSAAPLTNIPGKLRQLADEMDREGSAPVTLVWVQSHEDGEITVGAFGDNPSKAEVVGTLVLASRYFTPDAGETSRDQS